MHLIFSFFFFHFPAWIIKWRWMKLNLTWILSVMPGLIFNIWNIHNSKIYLQLCHNSKLTWNKEKMFVSNQKVKIKTITRQIRNWIQWKIHYEDVFKYRDISIFLISFPIFCTLMIIFRLLPISTVSNSNLKTNGGIYRKISYDIFKFKISNVQEKLKRD